MLVLEILGGFAALGLGIWLGLPGGERPTAAEVDKILDQPNRRRRRATRHFTPLDWFESRKRSPDRMSRHRFQMEIPEEEGGATES